jgi:NADH:ubiquinone oxidoreductase subunit 5 (subunit L)/multisubunit Na+/H+ antiporter MnhA subunit
MTTRVIPARADAFVVPILRRLPPGGFDPVVNGSLSRLLQTIGAKFRAERVLQNDSQSLYSPPQSQGSAAGAVARPNDMDLPAICILFALGLPLLGSPFVALAGRRLGRRVGWLAFAFPVISTAALLVLFINLPLPHATVVTWPWIPSLGINLSFLLDGLSLFFGLIVSGMGCLVFFYANHYLDDHYEHHGRFYCYLTLFMAAMLGTVFANNLMLLFAFWELTGLASFLLIGFLHTEESSRVGARQALLVTGFTGLVMLTGIIMLYTVTGTYQFSEIVTGGLPVAEHKTWLTVAMVLVVIGAFGKSAQFPLHFWLPNAMAAPTPVSAYLHSATMVKLGVFLCARIYPLFVENDLWAPLLSSVAFTTMALAAVLALLSHDLKAILAYSTVSQLGFLIGYYGLGPAKGVDYDYLHILNHVFYKGALFMIVGHCGARGGHPGHPPTRWSLPSAAIARRDHAGGGRPAWRESSAPRAS